MKLKPLFLALLTLWAAPALAGPQVPAPATCLECHSENISGEAFTNSVHGKNGCTSCHVELIDVARHMAGEVEIGTVNCALCHKVETEEHAGSVHVENGIGCAECHSDIHAITAWKGDKEAVVAACSGCHDTEAYSASVHGQAVAGGSEDSAACHDCHNLHSIRSISGADPNTSRAFHTEVCLNCHGNEEKMEHNGVFPLAVETYLESYHGKSYRLGFPEFAAGCSDCHTAHGVLSKDDPASTVNAANLVNTCSKCHEGASALFTRFYSHGDHADRANYPLLYWTFKGMTGLLVGTFAVFWVHTLLWMFRGFVENREKQRALAMAAAAIPCGSHSSTAVALDPAILDGGSGHASDHAAHHAAIPDGHKLYRRFEKRHIFLHLTVIISFLGLSLTGLPLKFSDQEWAKTMMSFFGGVKYAGLIHRGCAILTFYYFVGALLMSFDFLFIRKDVKTRNGQPAHWLFRLFGPDSLMPNFRDVKDIRDMVRWFLFRGPKPTFERWTYWEKFDFLAVFWGMFAIGGSGLMLMFPEVFGRFLPGWMFNIATIIHSDEALLATGFIFTVHFFNTHGRPEKFPMDFVIFNGQMTKEEFIEERGDQWKRYEDLGMTEEMVVTKPSGVLYDFFFKGFGFLAVFTGLALAFLMLLAFIKG